VPWQMGRDGADLPDETPTVRTYMGYLERRPDSVVGALATVAEPPDEGAALVHCAAGKDRTGIVVAFALEVAGAGREAVLADYAATGERIEAIVARLASSPTYVKDVEGHAADRHRPRPHELRRVLELVDERHGGAAGWLADHGFDAEAQAALRARLRAA
jgi:protein-tyrosine phosphatase